MFLSLETDRKLYLEITEELPKESPVEERRHNDIETISKIQVIAS